MSFIQFVVLVAVSISIDHDSDAIFEYTCVLNRVGFGIFRTVSKCFAGG